MFTRTKEYYTVEIPLDVDLVKLADLITERLQDDCLIELGRPGVLGFLFNEEIDELQLRRIVYDSWKSL